MDNKRRSGRALVIQLDNENIRIARMNLGSAAQFQECTVVSTPEGAVEDGVIRAPEVLQEALAAALAAPEFRRVRRVVFSLCTTQVISERVTIPAVPERRLGKLLESNMDMYFPVDIKDYHLVWKTVGREKDEDGKDNLSVQLWAVPNAMLVRYYALANACGLSVVGIDYCGSSLVSAVGASFSARQSRKGAKAARAAQKNTAPAGDGHGTATAVLERPATQEAEEPSSLYLLAEPEHLVMTFVQDGQVKLQRVLLRDGAGGEMTEAQMVLEYYRSMDGGRDSEVGGVACGAMAGNGDYVARLGEALNLPVETWNCQQGPEWCVCLGAARGTLEFGVPSMNRPGGVSTQLGQAWQYALVLVGGAAFVLTLLLTFGTNALWKTGLDGLKATERALQLQAAQNQGNAARYREYLEHSENYSQDWDALFRSLRTYNDNLTLMLDELEGVLPADTSVTGIAIASEGLGLQFACSGKEEAAYLIIALRSLQYATLDGISDLTVGPGTTAGAMLPSLAGRVPAYAGNSSTEAPPQQGSGYDLETLLRIMELASQGSGSSDYSDILDYAISSGLITRGDLEQAVMSLTPEELDALEAAYGLLPDISYTMDELVAQASYDQRKNALSTMLSTDPIAQYRFFKAFQKDMERPAGTEILYGRIAGDLNAHQDLLYNVLTGDKSAVEAAIPVVVDIVTKDEETLTASENLIRTDASLARRYTYYLAVELGLQEEIDGVGGIDIDSIIDDIQTGNRPESEDPDKVDEAIESIVDSLVPGLGDLLPGTKPGSGNEKPGSGDEKPGSGNEKPGTDGTLDKDMLNWLLENLQKNNGSSSVPSDVLSGLLDGILNGGGSSLFPGGTNTPGSQPTVPVDDRIYFSVALGYKPALIEAELERKGLSYEDKLGQLEVLK